MYTFTLYISKILSHSTFPKYYRIPDFQNIIAFQISKILSHARHAWVSTNTLLQFQSHVQSTPVWTITIGGTCLQAGFLCPFDIWRQIFDVDALKVAARTLGDVVRKLGEKVLPEIIPILERGLVSERSDQRQGVCIGLSEIMSSTSKVKLYGYGTFIWDWLSIESENYFCTYFYQYVKALILRKPKL